jgi:dTDP-4-dehydrorhamnose reductase
MGLRVVVTGSGGQLGSCLVEQLRKPGPATLLASFDRTELDVAKPDQVAALFDTVPGGLPDVLVNAAAYTQVDRCEDERDLAYRINADAPELLAELCARTGVRLIHLSTDYVFDGRAREPYREAAPTAPQCVYGSSKLAGEERVLATSPDFTVVRTSWVFGPGKNFVGSVLRLAREQRAGKAARKLRVVDDQVGCPTYAGDLAEAILMLARVGQGGLFHLCNSKPTSWWGFARAILDATGYEDLEIERGKTEELNQKAPRPAYSVLDCSRAAGLGVSMRSWAEALGDYLRSPHGLRAQMPK